MHRSTGLPPASLLAVGLLVILSTAVGRADAPSAGPLPLRCVKVEGALLQKQDGKPWQPVRPGEKVQAGDLLVALPYAELRTADGALKLVLPADTGQRGPFPVLETALRVGEDAKHHLEVHFERGILGLANLKKKGAVSARLNFAGNTWNLSLLEPDTRVGLELFSLYPPGLPALKEGKVGAPTTEVVLLTLRGAVFLTSGTQGYRLSAPPGPAKVRWDSASKAIEVHNLEKLPPSLLARNAAEEKVYQAICAAAARLNHGAIGPTVGQLIHSEQKVERRVGVTIAGALDDLPHLVGALGDPKHADVRSQAVLVLRHWIGRKPGQVGKLYDFLKGPGGYPAARARTVIQLLFGFSDQDRAQPDTYAVLLDLLSDKSLPVRELARWHLIRLAPAGRVIPYDAAAPAAERQRALKQWRALIPAGQLPGRGAAAQTGEK
jgi:hypothetical protein